MKSYSSNEMRRYNHLLREMDAVYHEMSRRLGLSDSAMIVLYTICEHGDGCPLREICRLCGLPKQTVNSALRRLEADGVVCLEEADARHKNVLLTEEGKRLAERTAVRILETENAIFAAWPREDVEKYLELTGRFLHDLKERIQ